MLSLINEVLDMAKIEAGKVAIENTGFDLGALLRDTIDMLSERAQIKGLQLLLEPSSNFPRYVYSDESKLRQILLNLIGNAIKYTKKGYVKVRLDAQTLANQHKYLLTFVIEDTGVGIAASDLTLIFKIFVQVGEESYRQGSGLGLPISKQYAQLMGGDITVSSEPNKGSIFTLQLPVIQVEAAEIAKQSVNSPQEQKLATDQPPCRVLIVEDHLENRILLKKLLTSAGFQVFEAENGQQGVEQFIRWQPHFIWMDRRMPVMDGIEATEKIRALENGKDVKIVALTASVFSQQKQQLLEAGVDDIIFKPYRESEIFDCMAKHLGVCLIYSELQISPPHVAKPLSAETLQQLPQSLLKQLQNATTSLDIEQSMEVIELIEMIDADLAEQLAQRINQFDFAAINELFSNTTD